MLISHAVYPLRGSADIHMPTQDPQYPPTVFIVSAISIISRMPTMSTISIYFLSQSHVHFAYAPSEIQNLTLEFILETFDGPQTLPLHEFWKLQKMGFPNLAAVAWSGTRCCKRLLVYSAWFIGIICAEYIRHFNVQNILEYVHF